DFALTVKGDSMTEAGIFEGDVVFIKKTSLVRNGAIAAVLLLDSNEATIKKFYKKDTHVLLQPCNSHYEPIITKDVLILGE
ncbi:LexA family transcriptional repressor, partial [Streptococcus danieliae]|nr:LexA family transcriptional repressor [Streptococcus danieliae]